MKPGEFMKLATRKNLVYLVKGKDSQNRELFHFVKVDPLKKAIFLHDCDTPRINVEDYGEILLSGYGKPGEEEKRILKEKYDINADID